MRFHPDSIALASLREAHVRMRSALALLDLVEGTGFPAAHLQHAISLLEEKLGCEPSIRDREAFEDC